MHLVGAQDEVPIPDVPGDRPVSFFFERLPLLPRGGLAVPGPRLFVREPQPGHQVPCGARAVVHPEPPADVLGDHGYGPGARLEPELCGALAESLLSWLIWSLSSFGLAPRLFDVVPGAYPLLARAAYPAADRGALLMQPLGNSVEPRPSFFIMYACSLVLAVAFFSFL